MKHKKSALSGALKSFAFRLCRLGAGYGLTSISHLEAGETPHGNVLA
jgi:hypothetical protein